METHYGERLRIDDKFAGNLPKILSVICYVFGYTTIYLGGHT